jgi:hypothetical protein
MNSPHHRELAFAWTLLTVASVACRSTDSSAPIILTPPCEQGIYAAPLAVPACLEATNIITPSDRQAAAQVLMTAATLDDSLRADTGIQSFNKASELTRALQHVSDFYGRRLFDDSARFHRMIDHVAVTVEYVRGTTIRWVNGRAFPQRTPWLSWQFYPNVGFFFQPVNTMQFLEYLLPRASSPTDSIVQTAEHMYDYAMWRDAGGRPFPVWEYDFTWTSGGVTADAPWISGMAQGLALALFSEAYLRTGRPVWRARTYEVLNSFYVPWDRGGVLLPDTSRGYWWEEFHPTVQVWNGSAWALLGLGYMRSVMHDPEVDRLYQRGVDALKYYTPFYDTGSWTLYSRTQGYNSVAYHNLCIRIMDEFYLQNGDPWFKEVADRWRSYVPPPGVK